MLLWNKLIFLCFAPTTCFTDFTDALVWRQLAWPVPTPAPNDRGTPSQHRPVIGDHLIGATPFALAAKFAEGEIFWKMSFIRRSVTSRQTQCQTCLSVA